MASEVERAENSLMIGEALKTLDRMQESYNKDLAKIRYVLKRVHLDRKAKEVKKGEEVTTGTRIDTTAEQLYPLH